MANYNTAINPLGSIPDINVILETIKHYYQHGDIDKTKNGFIEGNAFGFDISSSRRRFFAVIKKLFLTEPEDEANQFFIETVSLAPDMNFKKEVLYLEVCRKNDLFRDIVINLVYKKYKENRRLITSIEVYDFLTEYGQDSVIDDWSKSTVKTICSKYITFMKRLGFFKKDKGLKSMFSFPYPDEKIVTYIVFLLKLAGYSDNDLYQSDLFTALMLDEQAKVDLLKKGSLAGYYDFTLSGNRKANFSLKYSREEIIDEFREKY